MVLPILQIFRKSVEFCNEHDVWRLNVAHVLFMQVSRQLPHTRGTHWSCWCVCVVLVYAVNIPSYYTPPPPQEAKYKEAIGFYEPIVKKHYKNVSSVLSPGSLCVCVCVHMCKFCLCLNLQILTLSAVILANLCVSYIMSSQTEDAEELMRKIEKEEVGCVLMEVGCTLCNYVDGVCACVCVQEKLSYEDPDRKLYHLCIVNLVIGTLYCAKGNYEFGIGRIMKSLEPYQRKVRVCVPVYTPGQLWTCMCVCQYHLYCCHCCCCHCSYCYHMVLLSVGVVTCYCCVPSHTVTLLLLPSHTAQLGTDTWYYAKRCLLSLLEYMV